MHWPPYRWLSHNTGQSHDEFPALHLFLSLTEQDIPPDLHLIMLLWLIFLMSVSVDNAPKWGWIFLPKYDLHPIFGVNNFSLHACVCCHLLLVGFNSAEITSIYTGFDSNSLHCVSQRGIPALHLLLHLANRGDIFWSGQVSLEQRRSVRKIWEPLH